MNGPERIDGSADRTPGRSAVGSVWRRWGIPRGTWIAMIGAAVLAAMAPDYGLHDSGASAGGADGSSLLLLAMVIVAGLMGAVAAVRARERTPAARILWAIVSAAWGVALIYLVVSLTYVLGGP